LLRRGFKSQCERRSAELRRGLGLTPDSPLSAMDVARQLEVTVWDAADVDGLSEGDLRQLTGTDAESWSGLTLRIRDRHLVIFNPAQSRPRINSVLMHELSHIMLGHELASAGMTCDGHLIPSNYDQDQEDEADWLGGTLLLPRPALLAIRHAGLADDQARQEYQVSKEMLAWRLRMTGVDYQIAHARNKRARFA